MRRSPLALGTLWIAAAALLSPAYTQADTTIGGAVETDLRLTSAGAPYLVASDLIVRNGATLTIEAGVVVRVGANVNVSVENGALRILGSAASRVRITSAADVPGGTPAAGDWGVLRFQNETRDPLTRLEHVDIRYGQGMVLEAASPTLESVAIASMAGPAIDMDLASFPTGSNNAASGCGLNAVRVAAGEMTVRGQWTLRGIPYVLEGPVSVGAVPTITGIEPTEVEQDGVVPASIRGTRLQGTSTVTLSGTGATADVQVGGTGVAVPVLVDVPPDAPLGPRTFVLDTAAGLTSSGAVVLTVVPATPVLQTIAPSAISAGAGDTTVTLGGRKFNVQSVVRVGATAVATTFVSPTQLTAVIPAALLATPATLSLTVANPDPRTPGQFLVSQPAALLVELPPTIAGITPGQGARGREVSVAISGTRLSGSTNVTFAGSGVTAAIQSGGSATNLPVRLTIAPDATTGPRSFQVTAPGGTASSDSVTFTVIVPVPVVGSVQPGVGIVSTAGLTVTVDGTGFTPESVVQFSEADRTTTFISPTRLTAVLTAADLTSLGTFPIRVVNPDAANPTLRQISNVFSFQVVQPSLSLTPSPLNVQALQSATATVRLSMAAPPGGIDITLSVAQPLVATVGGGTTTTVRVAEGATEATVSLEGVMVGGGATTLTATATGFVSATATVNVAAAPRLDLAPAALVLGVGRQATLTVSSTINAPAGGLVVTLAASPAGIVSLPATVTIPAGAAIANVHVDGTAPGATTITPSAPGFAPRATSAVSVRATSIVLPASTIVSPGLSRPLVVSLTDPAPAGGTILDFTSSNPAAFDPPAPVQIAEGGTSATITLTGKSAGTGALTGTDRAGSFQSAATNVLVQAVNVTFAPASGSTFKGPGFRARSTVFINAAAPAGGQPIDLVSTHPSVATVPAQVLVPAGATSVEVEVTGVGAGAATITPSAPGLTTAGTFSVTVIENVLTVSRNVGFYGVRTLTGVRSGPFHIALAAPAPSAVSVTVASSDPAVVRVAPYNGTAVPAGSHTLTIPAGGETVAFDVIGVGVRDFAALQQPRAVLVDPAGHVFLADTVNHGVRRVDAATGILTTVAGIGGSAGVDGDGQAATAARLRNPSGLALDADGHLFIADTGNHRVRRLDAVTGLITTVAGHGGTACGQQQQRGDGGPATSARLCSLVGLAFDSQGRLLVADTGFHRVRRIEPGADGRVTGAGDETITTVAGNGTCTFAGDGAAATAASLCSPSSVLLQSDGSVVIADQDNDRVRRVDAATGLISTIAGGTGSCGTGEGVPATAVGLCRPSAVARDGQGRLYVSERSGHRIRRIAAGVDGVVTGTTDEILGTMIGTGQCRFNGNGRPGLASEICNPYGLTIDGAGGLLFADEGNHQVRRVDGNGAITTLAGSGESAFKGDGGAAIGSQVMVSVSGFPSSSAPVVVLGSALLLQNLEILRTTASPPDAFTLGLGHPTYGFNFRAAQPLSIDLSSTNPAVASVSASVTIADNATSSSSGTATVVGPGTTTIGAAVSAATLPVGPIAGTSTDVVVQAGRLGVGEDPQSPSGSVMLVTGTSLRSGAYAVGLSDPAPSGGTTVQLESLEPGRALLAPHNTTVAGTATLNVTVPAGTRSSAAFNVIGVGTVDVVRLNNPSALARDAASATLYVADMSNHRVRRLDGTTGVVTTVAGNGACPSGTGGDGGPAIQAGLCNPQGLALDAAGNLFITDTSRHRIRRVDRSTGEIATVVGDGVCRFGGDGAAATSASLCNPLGLAFDASGALLIADQTNDRVRRVVPGEDGVITGGTNEVITTVAGTGTASYNGDDQPATSATLNEPSGVAVDTDGAVLIADRDNHRVRRVSAGADGVVTGASDESIQTVAGTGTASFGGDGAGARLAGLRAPLSVTVGAGRTLLIADRDNNRVRRVSAGAGPGVTGEPDEVITTLAGTGTMGYNGDGQLAVLAQLWNPRHALETESGAVLIVDQSHHRIRRVDAGIIRTELGTNQGYSGDGGPGGRVKIRATAAGFTWNESGVQVNQTTLALAGLEGLRTTASSSDDFTVTLQASGVGAPRAAKPLTVGLTTSQPGVEAFLPGDTATATVTIPDNVGSSSTATLRAVGAGTTTIGAGVLAPPAGAITGTSADVVVQAGRLGVGEDPQSPNGSVVLVTGTSVRSGAYAVGLSDLAPSGGTTVQLESLDPGRALLAPHNAAVAGTATLNVTVPAGTRTSTSFNVIGVGTVEAVRLNNPSALVREATGAVLYVADMSNHRVRRFDLTTGIVTTVAGNGACPSSGNGGDGGPATQAGLCSPQGLALDASGHLFIADTSRHRIRRVDQSTGEITTVVGDAVCRFGGDGAAATSASLCNPLGLAFDASGALLIADQTNDRVRRVVPGEDGVITGGVNEVITTVAGTGTASYNGDDQPATSATLNEPSGVAVDTDGAVLIADRDNHRVRRVSAGADGVVTGASDESIQTVAGTGTASFGGDGAGARLAGLRAPLSVTVGAGRTLLIADRDNNRVRRVSAGETPGVTGEPDEVITTLAGTGTAGYNGDGQLAVLAQLWNPRQALEVQPGTILIVDQSHHRIRRVEAGIMRTELGLNQGYSGDAGPGGRVRIRATAAGFTSNESGVQVSPTTLVLSGLETLRTTASSPDDFTVTLQASGVVTPRAAKALTVGLTTSAPGVEAFLPGDTATATVTFTDNTSASSTATLRALAAGTTMVTAEVSTPPASAIAGTSANVVLQAGRLGVGDDPQSPNASTVLVTGTGVRSGAYTVSLSDPAPSGGTTVQLESLEPGRVLLAPHNTAVAGAATLGVTVPAGSRSSGTFNVIGLVAADVVRLNNPTALAWDAASATLYVADTSNHRVRRVDGTTGVVTTVAGNGSCPSSGNGGDGGPATQAGLCSPQGLALDASGHLFIADTSRHRIRRVDRSTGEITTVAGDGTCRFTGEGAAATSASLCNPVGLAFDSAQALLIADQTNDRLRRVVPGADAVITGATNEVITTVAGTGTAGFGGDDQPATSALLNEPSGVAVDVDGAVLIADRDNHRVRRVSAGADGVVTGASDESIQTVAGTGTASYGGDGASARLAGLRAPWAVSVGVGRSLLIADRDNHRVRRVSAGGSPGVSGEPDEVITTVAGTGSAGYSGDGQLAALSHLWNPRHVLETASGDVWIVDQSVHRIRRVEAGTGIIRTQLGLNQGYSGDGGPGPRARIRATASGFTSNDAEVNVGRSTLRVTPTLTTIPGLSTTYRVEVQTPGIACCLRVAQATVVAVAPSDTTVLALETPVTIADNATSTGNRNLTTVGAGTADLIATTSSAAVDTGSATVTVVPTLTSLAPNTGARGATVNAVLTGTNLANASSISISGTGVSAGIGTRTNTTLELALTIHGLAELGARTLTAITPGGNVTIGFTVGAP